MGMVSNSMEIWRIDSQISDESWEADAGRIDTSAPRGDHRQRTAGNLRSADEVSLNVEEVLAAPQVYK